MFAAAPEHASSDDTDDESSLDGSPPNADAGAGVESAERPGAWYSEETETGMERDIDDELLDAQLEGTITITTAITCHHRHHNYHRYRHRYPSQMKRRKRPT